MPDHIDYRPESARWRQRVAQEITREAPYQWAQRLLVYADELDDIEPHMALTMRVCGVLIEQANFYNSQDVRQSVDYAQDQIVDDCLFVVRHLTEQGAQDQARGALEVVKHLAGIESAPRPVQAAQPSLPPAYASPAYTPPAYIPPAMPRPSLSLPPPGPAPTGGSLSAALLSAGTAIRCFPA